jgi:hypothetical protein
VNTPLVMVRRTRNLCQGPVERIVNHPAGFTAAPTNPSRMHRHMNTVHLRNTSYRWLWAFGPYLVLIGASTFKSNQIAGSAFAALGLLLAGAGWLGTRRVYVAEGGNLAVAGGVTDATDVRAVCVTEDENGGTVRVVTPRGSSLALQWQGRGAMDENLDAWRDRIRERRFELASKSRIPVAATALLAAGALVWAFFWALPSAVPLAPQWLWMLLSGALLVSVLVAIVTFFSAVVTLDGLGLRVRQYWAHTIMDREDVSTLTRSEDGLLVRLRDGKTLVIKTRSKGAADAVVRAWGRS